MALSEFPFFHFYYLLNQLHANDLPTQVSFFLSTNICFIFNKIKYTTTDRTNLKQQLFQAKHTLTYIYILLSTVKEY